MQKFKERFDTLSDAILAIAMTILVLEIKTPATMGDIGDFTRNIGLFIVSFVVVFNFWYERAQNSLDAQKTNDEIIALDIIEHLGICLIPLFTKFMISFENHNFAVMAYGLLTLLVGLTSDIIRIRLASYDLVTIPSELKERAIKVMTTFAIRSVVVRFIIIILAYFLPEVGIFAYLVIPLFMFWRRSRAGKYYAKKGIEAPSYIKLFIQIGERAPEDFTNSSSGIGGVKRLYKK
ncbi:TMEM175 family protein [Streptococcus agalactiae]|nr:DUF1211 domain-containing protein [Streptococcus agalactiae]